MRWLRPFHPQRPWPSWRRKLEQFQAARSDGFGPDMKFSIITPSFRSARWLKLCIPSVADQDMEHEHIVQDCCSDDGTQEWLPKDPRVKAFIEKDQGMYDAVNRGLRRASGEILAYLNCDEQLLPGALQKVDDYFRANPGIEAVFADTVITDSKGDYLCTRQAALPHKYHIMVCCNLGVLTCALFFRRSLLERHGLFFNAQLKDIGDADWVLRALELKIPMGWLNALTSVFTETGANMNLRPNARREVKELYGSAPLWARRSRWFFLLQHRLRRLVAGHYRLQPFRYALYTEDSPQARIIKQVEKPAFRWRRGI